ncbi:MAG: carboxypeptidase-like regulatory domain-containing protein [Blastocatellia bacterium]|nr:carboxypeptidase-like regulatory domain-containing protein [Blastocatellia bacterium]
MNGKKTIKRLIVGCIGVTLFLAALFWPGLPWSAHVRYTFRRIAFKIETKIAAWRNDQPRPVTLSGKVSGRGAFVQALKGAQVVALESASGYAAMTDGQGRFLLPHLMWYPGATYNLVITAGSYPARRLQVSAPLYYPTGGTVDLGELNFEEGRSMEQKERPAPRLTYDTENDYYYRDLFNRLTMNLGTHHQKIDAINKYIAGRHNPEEDAWSFKSARQIIERGAPHCSNLAFALAIVAAAGGYPARTVHTSDTAEYLHTHVAVEVYYDDAWHLYDPTYGVFFLNEEGRVASYEELRLNTDLVTPEAFQGFNPKVIRSILEWMPEALASGFHQIYEVEKDSLCVVW